jgi:hypothetical protein
MEQPLFITVQRPMRQHSAGVGSIRIVTLGPKLPKWMHLILEPCEIRQVIRGLVIFLCWQPWRFGAYLEGIGILEPFRQRTAAYFPVSLKNSALPPPVTQFRRANDSPGRSELSFSSAFFANGWFQSKTVILPLYCRSNVLCVSRCRTIVHIHIIRDMERRRIPMSPKINLCMCWTCYGVAATVVCMLECQYSLIIVQNASNFDVTTVFWRQ